MKIREALVKGQVSPSLLAWKRGAIQRIHTARAPYVFPLGTSLSSICIWCSP